MCYQLLFSRITLFMFVFTFHNTIAHGFFRNIFRCISSIDGHRTMFYMHIWFPILAVRFQIVDCNHVFPKLSGNVFQSSKLVCANDMIFFVKMWRIHFLVFYRCAKVISRTKYTSFNSYVDIKTILTTMRTVVASWAIRAHSYAQ